MQFPSPRSLSPPAPAPHPLLLLAGLWLFDDGWVVGEHARDRGGQLAGLPRLARGPIDVQHVAHAALQDLVRLHRAAEEGAEAAGESAQAPARVREQADHTARFFAQRAHERPLQRCRPAERGGAASDRVGAATTTRATR